MTQNIIDLDRTIPDVPIPLWLKAIFSILLAVIITFTSCEVGKQHVRKSAVVHNAAIWTVVDESGNTEFTWKRLK